MTATLSIASVTITSESIRQTSGKYLHQIICYRPRKRKKAKAKVRRGEGHSAMLRTFCIRLRILPFAVACSHLSFLQLRTFIFATLHSREFALKTKVLKMVHTIATNFYNISNCSNSFNLIVTIINELPNAFLFYFNLNKSRLFDDHNQLHEHSVSASCSFTLLPTQFPFGTTACLQIDMAGNIIRLTTQIKCIAYPSLERCKFILLNYGVSTNIFAR